MWIIFNVFVEFVTILLLFKFWIFSPKVYGILVHQPGIKPGLIKPAPPCIGRQNLKHWSSSKVLYLDFLINALH